MKTLATYCTGILLLACSLGGCDEDANPAAEANPANEETARDNPGLSPTRDKPGLSPHLPLLSDDEVAELNKNSVNPLAVAPHPPAPEYSADGSRSEYIARDLIVEEGETLDFSAQEGRHDRLYMKEGSTLVLESEDNHTSLRFGGALICRNARIVVRPKADNSTDDSTDDPVRIFIHLGILAVQSLEIDITAYPGAIVVVTHSYRIPNDTIRNRDDLLEFRPATEGIKLNGTGTIIIESVPDAYPLKDIGLLIPVLDPLKHTTLALL